VIGFRAVRPVSVIGVDFQSILRYTPKKNVLLLKKANRSQGWDAKLWAPLGGSQVASNRRRQLTEEEGSVAKPFPNSFRAAGFFNHTRKRLLVAPFVFPFMIITITVNEEDQAPSVSLRRWPCW